MPRRLARKPGVSLQNTGCLPRDLQKVSATFTVSSDVTSVFTISTSCITGTGLKKCSPKTWLGLLVVMAMSRMDRQDVLLAMMVFGGQILSRLANTFFF